jgi:hypothetical protein
MSRIQNIQRLIANSQRRLQKLKEQQASFGLHTPPHISIEIEDTETEISELQVELFNLQAAIEHVFVKFLEDDPRPQTVKNFLQEYPQILGEVVGGVRSNETLIKWSSNFPNSENCVFIGRKRQTTRTIRWNILLIGSPADKLITEQGELTQTLENSVAQILSLQAWLQENLTTAEETLSEIEFSRRIGIGGVVIAGRRAKLTNDQIATLKNRSLHFDKSNISVRTYDTLIDTARRLGKSSAKRFDDYVDWAI